MAIFALGEVFKSFQNIKEGKINVQKDFGRIWITREDWRRSWLPILRSSPLGFFIGALPGAGGTMASLMAYNNEHQLSKHPDEFGEGAVEGLAAPEAANNAASVGAMIPMLTLGIPGSGTTAVMMGALMILGLKPGPLLFQQQPVIIWGLIASMFIGNIILAVVNIPLAKVLVRVLSVPPKVLYPIVLGLSFVGAYAISSSVMDFYILLFFGVLGYLLAIAKIPTSPLILAVIVGNNMEQSFRRAYTISDSSLHIFFDSPISITLFILTLVSIGFPILKTVLSTYRTRKGM